MPVESVTRLPCSMIPVQCGAVNARTLVHRRTAERARRFPDLDPRLLACDGLPARDAALARAIDHAVARRWLTLAAVIDSQLTDQRWAALHPSVQAALLVGAAQLLLMEKIPDHAAIDQAVRWIKTTRRARASGLVNAVLRKVASLRCEITSWRADTDSPAELPRDAIILGDGRLLTLNQPVFAEAAITRLAQQTSHSEELIARWMAAFDRRGAMKLALHGLVHAPIIVSGVGDGTENSHGAQQSGTGILPVRGVRDSTSEGVPDLLTIHRRNLPHWQIGGSTYFITFRLHEGELSEGERRIVADACMHWHGDRLQLHLATIMPDHVHLIITPLKKSDDSWHSLPELMHSIKSHSARAIQQMRGHSGPLWQDEYFDRIIRDDEEFLEKWNYILNNPVKAGLVTVPEEYQFTVRPETSHGQDARATDEAAHGIMADSLEPHHQPGFAVFTGERDELDQLLAQHPQLRIQDPTAAKSVNLARHVDPTPSLVIDYCAGKGTKTRQLAQMFPNARIIATDKDAGRFATLNDALNNEPNIAVVSFRNIREFLGMADLLVLDVPCSNTGVLARRVEAKCRFTRASLASLVTVQRQIFADAIPLMKEEAWMLYTTCSVEPSENQQQVEWMTKTLSLSLVEQQFTLPNGLPGDSACAYHDGGYAAVMRWRIR